VDPAAPKPLNRECVSFATDSPTFGYGVALAMSSSAAEGEVKRQEAVDRVLADPPVVHYMSLDDVEAGTLTGVWSTAESCYRFLADHCRPGDQTLETGAGLSTVLFAAWGTNHTCVAPGREEIEAVIDYCRHHHIPTETLTFIAEPSDRGLPNLPEDRSPFDLVFIDGCHGFPAPMIDWYYGAGRLRLGGIVVIDDLHLPAVEVLDRFLTVDTRWKELSRSPKWVAFERQSAGPLGEDWFMQPFYTGPSAKQILRERAVTLVRSCAKRVKRRLASR
jgi:hypothetical protein